MAVKTAKVAERRKLAFATLDDIVDEAERLAAAESAGTLTMLGNWPLGRMLDHIARAMDTAIDGVTVKPPLLMRLMMPILKPIMKRQMRTTGVPAGFKMPKNLEPVFLPPEGITTEEGLEHLKHAVDRMKTVPTRALHVAFGKMTHEEWDLLQRRHAEMHLGFALPGDE